MLVCYYAGSFGLLIIGIVVLKSDIIPNSEKANFTKNFIVSLVLGWILPHVSQIVNWIMPSWDGILFLPTIYLPGYGQIPKDSWYPLLNKAPFKHILAVYKLGGKTYDEEKKEWEEKYPGRSTIDAWPVVGNPNPDPNEAQRHSTSGSDDNGDSKKANVDIDVKEKSLLAKFTGISDNIGKSKEANVDKKLNEKSLLAKLIPPNDDAFNNV